MREGTASVARADVERRRGRGDWRWSWAGALGRPDTVKALIGGGGEKRTRPSRYGAAAAHPGCFHRQAQRTVNARSGPERLLDATVRARAKRRPDAGRVVGKTHRRSFSSRLGVMLGPDRVAAAAACGAPAVDHADIVQGRRSGAGAEGQTRQRSSTLRGAHGWCRRHDPHVLAAGRAERHRKTRRARDRSKRPQPDRGGKPNTTEPEHAFYAPQTQSSTATHARRSSCRRRGDVTDGCSIS